MAAGGGRANVLNLVEQYFQMELSYKEIIITLSLNHGISMSLRHIKRILRDIHLSRRKEYTDLNTVIYFIEGQVESNGMHGYRWMYRKCIVNGLKVKKEQVRLILQMIDPVGVEVRSKNRLIRRQYFGKGPNYCWHIDSYDKLKPYGLCINGCIDGFSRNMLWVKVGRTNSDPKVVARYYIEAVENVLGCPFLMRGDMGTENVTVAEMQNFLSRNERNEESFMFGKSTMNTRIESWWGILRKELTDKWIEDMKNLRDSGHFTGSKLDVNMVQFCFMKLLQDSLDETVMVWNTHKIRCSSTSSFHGRPYVMYLLPELFNTRDYLQNVTDEEINVFKRECVEEEMFPCDEDLFELGCVYMNENTLNPPSNMHEAKSLYLGLRRWILTNV